MKRSKGEEKEVGPSGLTGITVQRLSVNVEGKCQKYSRIGPLTLVPLEKEPTLEYIKAACKAHFDTHLECDVLAGEQIFQKKRHKEHILLWAMHYNVDIK